MTSRDGTNHQTQNLCVRVFINGGKEYAPESECNTVARPSIQLHLNNNIEKYDRRWIYSEYSQVIKNFSNFYNLILKKYNVKI